MWHLCEHILKTILKNWFSIFPLHMNIYHMGYGSMINIRLSKKVGCFIWQIFPYHWTTPMEYMYIHMSLVKWMLISTQNKTWVYDSACQTPNNIIVGKLMENYNLNVQISTQGDNTLDYCLTLHFISLLHVLFYLAPTIGDLRGYIGFAWKPFYS